MSNEEMLKNLNEAIPKINEMVEMYRFENAVSILSEKAANASKIHATYERLKRQSDLLLQMILINQDAIKMQIARIVSIREKIEEMTNNLNVLLLDTARLNAMVQSKKEYVEQLDNMIEDKKERSSFENSKKKLEELASIARQFSPVMSVV